MKYTLFLQEDYLTGWQIGGDFEIDTDKYKDLQDEYGNYKYQLIDGEIILNPQKPTDEQLQKKYKQVVKSEISKKYTIEDELKILFRGSDEERKEHEDYIASCKSKSMEATYGTTTSGTSITKTK